MMQRTAPAKINLGLHVLRRRPDGYHDIDTVFLKVGWEDVVSAVPSDQLSLTCSDGSLPTDEQNLCMKAAVALAEVAGVNEGAALHLEKYLPYGAGLGGGSSDAAATMLLLNELWETQLGEDTLHTVGASLGADVPVFLGEAPAYRGEQRGDVLTPMTYVCPFHFVIVMPDIHVATPDAYRWITPQEAGRPDLPAIVASNDLTVWRTALVNDFEAPVAMRFPEIQHLKQRFFDAGAGYSAMSGSGASVFGVFESHDEASACEADLSQQGYQVWRGNSL